jgi:hypothetical protein
VGNYKITYYVPILMKPKHLFFLATREHELLDECDGVVLTVNVDSCDLEIRIRRSARRSDVDALIQEQGPFGWPGLIYGYEEYAEFEFSATYPGDDIAKSNIQGDIEGYSLEGIWFDVFRSYVEAEFFAVQIACHLAYPASASDGKAICEINSILSVVSGQYSPLTSAYEYLLAEGRLEQPRISLLKTWSWLARRNGFRIGGVADTPAAKALSYFTHIFEEQFRSTRFTGVVWSCAGLESFYGEDQSARANQISQKIVPFLNVDEEICRKDISSIYKVRSSIIHGNKSISSAVAGGDGMPEKHLFEETDALYFGVYYLAETLRACIARDLDAAKFRTVFLG